MLPKRSAAQAAAIPLRAFFIYVPPGYKNGHWIPTTTRGVYPDVTTPATAAALQPYQSKLNFITGCGNTPAAFGNGGDGIHARATGTFLYFQHLLQTGLDGDGITARQVIAKSVGTTTCVPSIVTGIPGERLPGFNEDAYAAMYLDNIAFVLPRSNVQKDSNPQTLFRRLVMCSSLMPGTGTGGPPPDPMAVERTKFEKTVMSAVKDEAKRLSSCVGVDDRARLDQYYTSISELEQRFTTVPPVGMPSMSCMKPGEPPASGADFQASIHLMMDVIIFGFRCGITRVASMMLDGAFSRRNSGLP